jgi:hypothetical protein
MSYPDSPDQTGRTEQMIFIRPPRLQPPSVQDLLDESADRRPGVRFADDQTSCESPAAGEFVMTGLFGIIPDADKPPLRLAQACDHRRLG